jgi:hypothetical protein
MDPSYSLELSNKRDTLSDVSWNMATTVEHVTTATMSSFLKDKTSSVNSTPLDDIPNVSFQRWDPANRFI